MCMPQTMPVYHKDNLRLRDQKNIWHIMEKLFTQSHRQSKGIIQILSIQYFLFE